ncbi:MAG: alpha-L-rhamnosidase N-terminal domain-containing protein, partial [Clostridia bacterium]|nr:alpha-L-rhamnosidase N-terminal domain-containing protein [Clostridia bacterium]
MFENVKWITCGKDESNPLIFRKIVICDVKRVRISICGLGFYELFINGKRVGNEFYKPAFSDYSERDFSSYTYPLNDITSHTVYYNVYDVTDYLNPGDNILSVLVGNGYYRQKKRIDEGDTSFNDKLIVAFEIELEHFGGEKELLCSDGTEKFIKSFITDDNLFYGETQDFLDFSFPVETDIVSAKNVEVTHAPDGVVKRQNCPFDRIIRSITPKIVFADEERTVYDVGENITGHVELVSTGDDVSISHSEVAKGSILDFTSIGGDAQIYRCTYKNTKKGQRLFPYFSWGGFSFFEVRGKASNVKVNVIHADIPVIATFKSDNETLNWLFDSYIRTQLNNMHCGIPTDCPHRERLGYTGDAQLTMESALLTLDSADFYRKWLKDLRDCQDVKTGHIQHTAPFCGGGGGPGGWGGAIILCPYYYYKITGDKSVIEENFESMSRYLECMKGFSNGGLIVKERERGWCLGEWGTPDKVIIPEPFVNTYYYIRCMEIFSYLASEIGKISDQSAEIALSKAALVREYYNAETNGFCDGVQGANVFALSLGLGNEEMKKSLIGHYERTKAFDVGIFGLSVLSEYLVESGNIQLLFDLLTTDKYPSFHYMKTHGATTVWEAWDGSCSHDHPMYCSFIKQFFYGFLGIKAKVGSKDIDIKPQYIKGLSFVEGSIKTGDGRRFFV